MKSLDKYYQVYFMGSTKVWLRGDSYDSLLRAKEMKQKYENMGFKSKIEYEHILV